MVYRDPETGQFVAGDGDDQLPEIPEMIVLDTKGDVGTPYADWETDEAGEGSWRTFDLPSGDRNHVPAIYAVETLHSDLNELTAGNPSSTWWFSGTGPLGEGSWTTKTTVSNFLTYHEVVRQSGGTGDGTTIIRGGSEKTNFYDEFGAPLIVPSGDITVCHEYLGTGAEVAWAVHMDFVEVSDDYLLEELIEQGMSSRPLTPQ